jgi:L-cysteine/cystine lyase
MENDPLFPVLERYAYLNAGTFGPLSRGTIDAMVAETELGLEQGRSGGSSFERVREARNRVRRLIAGMVGVGAEHVALTYSTTSGCQIVVTGLGLAPDDEIVTTDEEHIGLLGPLHASGARVRVAKTRGLASEQALEAIMAEVGRRTKLVAMSHVSWMTGSVLPVAAVKEATAVPLLVDGAQSVGAIPVDVGRADFYTVSGQKWLCGPDATGALYVADPERLGVALPSHWSSASHGPDGAFVPVDGAARFDPGTVPLPSLAGLEWALHEAPAARYDLARAATDRCRSLLAERYDVVTTAHQGTLVTFRPNGDPGATVARLYEAGVVVRDLPRTKWVRVSCGYWTTDEHLERMLAALA